MAETPVLTSTQPEQLELFARFMAELRANNVQIATEEARRLDPYFEAYAKITAVDYQEAHSKDPAATDLSKPGALSRLFNRAAANTKNTILSGLVIAPMKIFETAVALKDTTQFSALSDYRGFSFRFGFIQTFEDNKNGSTSIPVLAFNDDLMKAIALFQPQAMLKALQTVATSSNHDMLHHFTSTILNPNIAETASDSKLPAVDLTIRDWGDLHFNKADGDSDPKGYEAWLMLEHERVRRVMEEGPEGEALKAACDTCFAELKRIGAEIAAADFLEKAHQTVDYFGTMLLFAMSRSMPLNHPLMDHAISSLQQADPGTEVIMKQKEEILWRIECPVKEGDYAEQTVANYRAKGTELVRKEHDYASLKKLQLINIEPWVAHLMSPGQAGTELREMQARVGEVNRDMLEASALTSWFNAVDGLHTATRADGSAMETYFEDGQLHRTDGPAIIMKDKEGQIIGEQWFQNGQRYRTGDDPDLFRIVNKKQHIKEWHDEAGWLRHQISTNPESPHRHEVYQELWFDENRKHHREDGPASVIKDAAGNTIEEEWKQHGNYYREDGPSIVKTDSTGTHIEKWFRGDGEFYRLNGPALVEKNPSNGYSREEWFDENGKHHRVGGPAVMKTFTTGASEESWYKNGKLHNKNGPAYITVDKDGIRREKWYINGEAVETPAKQPAASPAGLRR